MNDSAQNTNQNPPQDNASENPPPLQPTPPLKSTQPPTSQVQPPPANLDTTQEEPQLSVVTPSILQPENVIPSQEEPVNKPKKPLFLILAILILVVILFGSFGLTYAIAYEKVKINVLPDFQKKLSFFVINLPFMPKTPKFLLEKTAMAHQNVTKQSFNISLALDSADLASSLGLNTLDLEAKGALDYTTPKNLLIVLDASITKDFNFELKKKDKILYFRINKIPAFLFAFIGLNDDQLSPILDKWIAYDTSPLETEARKKIQEDKEVDPLSQQFLDENFNKYIDSEVLKKISLSEETVDNVKFYKLTLTADPALIDHLVEKLEKDSLKESGASLDKTESGTPKPSEMIKKLEWEIFIAKNTFYAHKFTLSLDLEIDNTNTNYGSYSTLFLGPSLGTGSKSSKAKITFVAESGDFGKDVVLQIPEESMSFEEFTNTLSEIFKGVFSSLANPNTLPDSASP